MQRRSANRALLQAISYLEPENVAAALDLGASPNARLSSVGNAHPFEYLMTMCRGVFAPFGTDDERRRFVDIGHLLLACPALDLSPQAIDIAASPLDKIVTERIPAKARTWEWVHLAASAVIKTLGQNIESREPLYHPNLRAVFSFLGEYADPTGVRSNALETFKAVHECVRNRLNNPVTTVERQVAAHTKGLSFWDQSLPEMDQSDFPLPSHAVTRDIKVASDLFDRAARRDPYALLSLQESLRRVRETVENEDNSTTTPKVLSLKN